MPFLLFKIVDEHFHKRGERFQKPRHVYCMWSLTIHMFLNKYKFHIIFTQEISSGLCFVT